MAAHSDDKDSSGASAPSGVTTGGWAEQKTKLRRKAFPGPADAKEPLRVSITRDAYAELTAHAKGSLNAEICGVLIGELCEDDGGPFVQVDAVIRGAGARKGSTHVTFTQETWTQIHEEKDKKYPKRQMVGWYHTHPGFGVEFSEMDLFVQRNFFPGAGQIAFVTDPLGGEEAILVNSDGQVVPVSRFWVEGRERRCKTNIGQNANASPASTPGNVDQALAAMDQRISQLMQLVDAQSNSLFRFLFAIGLVAALAICTFVGYFIYSAYTSQNRPPELQSFVPVPVQIGDKSVLLGVGIVKWDVPPALNAAFLQLEREKQAAATQPAQTQPAQTQPAAATTH